MRIAIFDYAIIPTNPVGSLHLRMLEKLCEEHEFVVFAVRFTNPAPERIGFVPVSVPMRPLALLYVLYQVVAPIVYLFHRLRGGRRFDLIQTVESNCWLKADIVYAHFCHRRFLRTHWRSVRPPGLRGFFRWLDHFLHSRLEPFVFRRARRIVVASTGLARELGEEYPHTRGKLQVLANAVNLEKFKRPADFSPAALRAECGFTDTDTVLVFVALGHFERKGLPLILEAMKQELPGYVKLLVVGGQSDLIKAYRRKVGDMGLSERVHFAGMQTDVRPYLWSADAFVLPSVYETFLLVALEAAAASLPLIVSRVHGVEEYLNDGTNGFLIECTTAGVAAGVRRFLALNSHERHQLGAQAQRDVARYGIEAFQTKWREVYREMER